MSLHAKIVAKLGSAVDLRSIENEMHYVAQAVESIILLRTQRGRFLNAGHRTSYSKGHERKRKKKGLPTNRVNLFFEGNLLQDMTKVVRTESDSASIQVGYIDGQSDPDSATLANYFNVDGVGKSRVLYEYLGLTDQEVDKIEKALTKRIDAKISGALR